MCFTKMANHEGTKMDSSISESEDCMETDEEPENETNNEFPKNKAGEILEYDETAYIMYHQASIGEFFLCFSYLLLNHLWFNLK